MKRTLTCTLLSLSLGAIAWGQEIQVSVDGTTLQFDQPPVMQGGRVMVPLRGIFEGLGAEVLYDARLRSIKATKGATLVELSLGSRAAAVNGAPVTLDVPADTLGGRTMVPLRFVSEALGAEVKWSPATRSVNIASAPGGDKPADPNPPTPAGRPQLDQIISNSTRPLKTGEILEVVATGDPGCQGRFEILGTNLGANMIEARPGRYEGKLRVESGMSVEQGVVVVHLLRGDQETIKEATRTVTLEGQADSPPQDAGQARLEPAPNSVVNTPRPTVRAELANLQRQSLRFFVDGLDFTGQVQRQGRSYTWTPGYDLNPGSHTVVIEGLNRQNQAMRESWNFVVQPSTAPQGAFWTQPFPSPGQSVATRPTVGARLLRPLRPNSLRFTIDGMDVTGQAIVNANQVAWTPGYDLNPGNHQVRLEGVDNQGIHDVQQWNFNVGGGNSGVTVNNLGQGSNVPANFVLQGNAPANAEVVVQVKYRKQVGIFFQNRTLQSSAMAGPTGQYSVMVQAQDVSAGGTMDVVVSARVNGNVVGQTQLQLRRI